MTKVAILPVPTEQEPFSYRAITRDKHSQGRTAGEALDALTMQLSEEDASLIVVQRLRPDRFFDAAQQMRLAELMGHWQVVQEKGATLPASEQAELDALAEAELRASAARAAALADELRR